MLGIYEPCPNNVRFLIKPLKKVGFKKKFYVKVRLNLKIRNMLGHIITIPAIRDKMGAAPVWNVVTFSGAGVIALIEVSSSTGFIRGSDDVV
jgi:hypothetical protein